MNEYNCNDKIIVIIKNLIKKGLGKNCIESALYFDYKFSISHEEFTNLYETAFNCLYNIKAGQSNELKELSSLCENEIVKDIIMLILKNVKEDSIKANIYKKYLLHKDKRGEYNKITLRDIDNFYEISKMCINYKKYKYTNT